MRLLAEWVLTSSLLILVVTALRALLGKRVSAGLRYGLWAVVLVRLLVPVQLFSYPVPASVLLEPDRGQIVGTAQPSPVSAAPGVTVGTPAIAGPVPDGVWVDYEFNATPVPPPKAEPLPVLQILGWLWLAGSLGMGLAFIASNFKFARRLRRVRTPLDGVDRPLPVYIAGGLPSPCLFGFSRPAVYVTGDTADDPVMLRHVLAHEYTHFRHGDHVWNILRGAALAVHWWNPLVWLAVVLSRRDCELACDEGALKRLGDGERVAYGRTLLALLTVKPRPGDLLTCATTMTGGQKSVFDRVTRIARAPKRWLWAAVVTVLAAALACVCAFGAAEPETADGPGPDSEASHGPVMTAFPAPLEELLARQPIDDDHDAFLVDTNGEMGTLLVTAEKGEWEPGTDTEFGGYNTTLSVWNPQDMDTPIQTMTVVVTDIAFGQHEVVDANFDGHMDLSYMYVIGNQPNYWYLWVWDEETGRFAEVPEYREISSPRCSPETEIIDGFARSSGAGDGTTTLHRWEDGKLVCVRRIRTWWEPGEEIPIGDGTAAFPMHLTVEDRIDGELALIHSEVLAPGVDYLAEVSKWSSLGRRGVTGYQAVLLGDADFILRERSWDGGKRKRTANIAEVPDAFSADDEYTKIWSFTVVDLDQDGTDEVLAYVCGVSGDMGGYLVLSQKDGQVYGEVCGAASGWRSRWFWDLKTDGTFLWSSPTGQSGGWGAFDLDTGEVEPIMYGEGEYPGSYDTFWYNGRSSTEAEYWEFSARQDEKADAAWYDFTPENIRAVLAQGGLGGTAAPTPAVEEGSLPFDGPMELMFCSGAGGWSTDLTLCPDGSFEGNFSDMDMGAGGPGYQSTEYVCKFHGRFGDIRQVTGASWSMALEELVIDTSHPIGEEWIKNNARYISSSPYGMDSKDGQPLEPGARFMLYTPDASGYRPTDELYGFNRSNTDDDSVMYQFWTWMPSGKKIGAWGPDTRLGCYGLCNLETGYGFFDLKAWGIA